MASHSLSLTYIGGPTALPQLGGLRRLTDPTFDPAGGEYKSGSATLRKLARPAFSPEQTGPVDLVLLSHDHHFDNLDRSGRAYLSQAKTVLTTGEGAGRLGGNSMGLEPWQSMDFPTPDGSTLRVTSTPAQHGPAGLNRGAVAGFVVHLNDAPDSAVYFSGDTVWFSGVEEVARRFRPRVAILNLGAARVPEVGPFHLTMTAAEAVQAAAAFDAALGPRHVTLVPLHFEGWAHFSEGRPQIAQAFASAGLTDRLRWPDAGRSIQIAL